MKNLQDNDLFNELRKRLNQYTEEPDDMIWANLSKQISSSGRNWNTMLGVALLLLITSCMSFWIGYHFSRVKEMDVEKTVSTIYEDVKSHADISKDLIDQHYQQEESDPCFSETIIYLDRKKNAVNPINNQFDKDIHTKSGSEMPVSTQDLERAMILQSIEQNAVNQSYFIDNDKLSAPGIPDSLLSVSLNQEDSLLKSVLIDSIELTLPKRKEKSNRIRMYSSLTSLVSYAKVLPFKNDEISVSHYKSFGPLSKNKLGVEFSAGIQKEVLNRWGVSLGASYYYQNQIIEYVMLSEDPLITIYPDDDSDVIFSPSYETEQVAYKMKNLGLHFGITYWLSKGRLSHQLELGGSYFKGMVKSNVGQNYDNSSSSYLFSNISVYSEYKMNESVSVFLRPIFQYGLSHKEEIVLPFEREPYKIGLGFGIMFNINGRNPELIR